MSGERHGGALCEELLVPEVLGLESDRVGRVHGLRGGGGIRRKSTNDKILWIAKYNYKWVNVEFYTFIILCIVVWAMLIYVCIYACICDWILEIIKNVEIINCWVACFYYFVYCSKRVCACVIVNFLGRDCGLGGGEGSGEREGAEKEGTTLRKKRVQMVPYEKWQYTDTYCEMFSYVIVLFFVFGTTQAVKRRQSEGGKWKPDCGCMTVFGVWGVTGLGGNRGYLALKPRFFLSRNSLPLEGITTEESRAHVVPCARSHKISLRIMKCGGTCF